MGEAAALTSALCWAAVGVVVTSLSARLPAAALSALQMTIASAALLLALIVSDLADASLATLLAVAGTGVIAFAIADPIYVRVLSIVGMQRTYPVTIGLFILLTTFGGVALLGERFTPGLLLGGALIVGGTYLILFRSAAAGAAVTTASSVEEVEARREPAFSIGGAVQTVEATGALRARA